MQVELRQDEAAATDVEKLSGSTEMREAVQTHADAADVRAQQLCRSVVGRGSPCLRNPMIAVANVNLQTRACDLHGIAGDGAGAGAGAGAASCVPVGLRCLVSE